ncbi:class I SAM-dependent methyltransferase [Candidatus Pelagibacter sp.]|nr:class I SAM-dependent methyltransferase [Candidatus Pelagibacter sp.]
MKYKKYFRKTSLKQKNIGDLFLEEIQKYNPKTFLEIGIFHGVTARNVCELMNKNHGPDFSYIGIDIFDEGEEYKDEVVPVKNFNNPLKNFYFKYIKKQNPYSIEAVEDLLSKFKENVTLLKGNSNEILKNIKVEKIDFIFIDGGHKYETVKEDLIYSHKLLNNKGTILCDDYNLSQALGVRKAIEEFSDENKIKYEIVHERFAKFDFN